MNQLNEERKAWRSRNKRILSMSPCYTDICPRFWTTLLRKELYSQYHHDHVYNIIVASSWSSRTVIIMWYKSVRCDICASSPPKGFRHQITHCDIVTYRVIYRGFSAEYAPPPSDTKYIMPEGASRRSNSWRGATARIRVVHSRLDTWCNNTRITVASNSWKHQ